MQFSWKWLTLNAISLSLLVSCTNNNPVLPGYIEGEYTYISSGITGTLYNLQVVRGQQVKKGEPLYELDPQPEQAHVGATKAEIASLEAQVSFAKIENERQQKLVEKGATPKELADQAQTNYTDKLNQLAAKKEQLIQTQWAVDQKNISAPVSGQVFDTYYRVGEKVQEGHPVLSLLEPKNILVLFYVPETLLSQIKLGQKIAFSCDSCKEKTVAQISYISPEAEYTPPVIYSKDTRYNLVYLIRAAMPENIAKNFHPGQPIDVYLHP